MKTAVAAKLPSKLVALATKEIGVEEVNGTNCGPRVNEYKAATWLPANKGWPWCAAFLCWLVREALEATGTKETKAFKRPRTASAYDLRNWSLEQDASTHTKDRPKGDLRPGDIIAFQSFSHCGLVTSVPDATGYFNTVEGNTDKKGSREGGAVMPKRRHISDVRFRIRFTL